jgi:hypothetical protein
VINRIARAFGRRPDRHEAPAGESFDPENPDNWLSLDYVHERVLAQLDAQSDLWDVVDARLRLILGVIGIVFAAALGLQRGPALIPFWAGALAVAAVILFLAAGIVAAWVYWPSPFDRPPDPASLRGQYLTTDPRVSKLEVIDTAIEAYNKNQRVIDRKNFAFKVAFVLAGIATGLLGGAIIAQVAAQTTSWSP